MRARVRVKDISPQVWGRLQHRLKTHYDIAEGQARVCVEFESGHPQDEVRHVEMPVYEFALVLTELNGLSQMVPAQPVAQGMARRPVLPTPEMVRDLDATQAVQLAADLNREINPAPDQTRRDGEVRSTFTPSAAERYRDPSL